MEQKKYVYFKSHLAHILWHPYRTLSNRRSHRAAARQPWIAEEEEEVERREEEKKKTLAYRKTSQDRDDFTPGMLEVLSAHRLYWMQKYEH